MGPWRSERASSRILRSSSSWRSRALARVACSAASIAAVSGRPAISVCIAHLHVDACGLQVCRLHSHTVGFLCSHVRPLPAGAFGVP